MAARPPVLGYWTPSRKSVGTTWRLLILSFGILAGIALLVLLIF